jgi:hypothetical protein
MATELQQPGTTPLSEILADIIPEASIFEEERKATEATEEQQSQPAETEEESEDVEESAADEEAEESESPDDEEDGEEPEQKQIKEWPESAQKRVDKLTAKLREAEAKAQELQAKIESAGQPEKKADQPDAQATTGDTLADVWDGEALTARAQSALNWKQWALENPDGGTLTIDGKEREYSDTDVKRILVNADKLLTVDIPKRREFLFKASQYEGGLRTEFPEFFQTESEEWKGIVGAFQELPALKVRPDGTGLALMLSLGLKEMARLREAKKSKGSAKAEAKPAVKKTALAPKPVNPAAAVSAPGPKASRANAKQSSIDDVVLQGGDVDALEKFFTS